MAGRMNQAGGAREKAVVLLSGGLDSAANLALCRLHDEPVLALTADYGQRAAEREVAAARALCRHYEVPHRVIELKWLGSLGGNALTDETRALPQLEAAQLDDAGVTQATARAVWVPNRNGVLINAAAAFAEREGAGAIVVGFNREEAATFPDNSTAFLEASTAALAFSSANRARVLCYTADWDKTRIVKELAGLPEPFPFEKVWSCYLAGDTPCGSCESCRRYSRALATLGIGAERAPLERAPK